MKVYVVMGGYDYEGYSETHMRIFRLDGMAKEYTEKLTTIGGIKSDAYFYRYDYATVFEREIVEWFCTGRCVPKNSRIWQTTLCPGILGLNGFHQISISFRIVLETANSIIATSVKIVIQFW